MPVRSRVGRPSRSRWAPAPAPQGVLRQDAWRRPHRVEPGNLRDEQVHGRYQQSTTKRSQGSPKRNEQDPPGDTRQAEAMPSYGMTSFTN